MFLWYVLWYYIVPPTNARTERETYRNYTTQPRISFTVYRCPIYLLQIKGRENLSLSVNFGNIHQLTGPWTSLLWVEPLLSTQKHTTCNWVKKCKKWPASILDVPAPTVRASPFSRRRQNPSVISAPLCKFRKYSPTDWAQNQSLVSITTPRYSKIHHL